jgi:hypothetical protein
MLCPVCVICFATADLSAWPRQKCVMCEIQQCLQTGQGRRINGQRSEGGHRKYSCIQTVSTETMD